MGFGGRPISLPPHRPGKPASEINFKEPGLGSARLGFQVYGGFHVEEKTGGR
jgi:hypothetical protein